MIRVRSIVVIVFAAMLAGCATSYQSKGLSGDGGVEAQMITNDTARISARGNNYTDPSTISDYVMLKSAETAVEHGYTHFAVMAKTNASGHGSTNYGNGISSRTLKPGQDLNVKFCKQTPKEKCDDMLNAAEIIGNLGPRYKK